MRANELKQRALGLLARREHSEQELIRKLEGRGFSRSDIARVMAELKQDGSQSDRRFTDSYIYHRIQRGYGPLRIRQELRERGIEDGIISVALDENGEDWMSRLKDVHAKKFGTALPAGPREQARQSRFLQYRGFTPEQIRRLFNGEWEIGNGVLRDASPEPPQTSPREF